MLCNRISLVNAVKTATIGVNGSKETIDGSDNILFADNRIFSFDGNTFVSTPMVFDEPISGSIKAKDFYSFISRIKDEKINIADTEDSVVIKSSRSVAEFMKSKDYLSEKLDYISPKNTGVWNDVPADIYKAIECCMLITSKTSISGVFFDDNCTYSTDEARLCMYKMSSGLSNRFWISEKSASVLLKEPCDSFCIEKSFVYFGKKDGTIFGVSRLDDSKYPIEEIKKIVDSNRSVDVFVINDMPDNIADSVGRVASMFEEIDNRPAIKIIFKKERIVICSSRSSGRIQETINWKDKMPDNFPSISVYVECGIAESCMRRYKKFYIVNVVREERNITRIVFIDDNSMYIIGTLGE